MMSTRDLSALKAGLFLLALVPLLQLVVGAINHNLGSEPAVAISRATGSWTFNFLLLTLSITPLRKLSGWAWLIRLRRMLGLFVFFYACLHLGSFVGLVHGFDPTAIGRDIAKRPFTLVGLVAFLLLVPLALTSSNATIRRMGGQRWQQLHYAIYPISILAAIHYFWLSKPEALAYPVSYALLLAGLLVWRARERIRRFGPFPDKQPRQQIALPKSAPIRFMPRPPRH
jgi:methionine sulfoxide reductase heme-binding subunit